MEVVAAKDWGGSLEMLEEVGQAALDADNAEAALNVIAKACFDTLGDRCAHLNSDALRSDERQFFVAGTFIVTPDTQYHMLVGNVGFPPEQRRLMVPLTGGHPGQVYTSKAKLILKNTDDHGSFRQYLKSSRMGSTIFAPLMFKERFLGQLIVAAQARNTMRDEDLSMLVAISKIATGAWLAHGGPAWLEANYPPTDGFYVDKEGLSAGTS